MSVYLDASVLLPILIDEPASAAVDTFMERGGRELLVSDFAAAEVTAALSRLVRMDLLSRTDAVERLEDFDMWRAAMSSPVDMHPADARLANAFVRRFELMLRPPDALHAAIARRLDVPLVTLNQRLAKAATKLGVTVELPTAHA